MSAPDATTTSRPLPVCGDELTEQFYAHCARGELRIQRCDHCDAWRHLPRYMCAQCGSPEWRWERASGNGRLFSWTVTHQPLHPAFVDAVPYVVAVVELDEGVRLVAALRGGRGGSLRLDLPVAVEFELLSETIALPCFRLALPESSPPS